MLPWHIFFSTSWRSLEYIKLLLKLCSFLFCFHKLRFIKAVIITFCIIFILVILETINGNLRKFTFLYFIIIFNWLILAKSIRFLNDSTSWKRSLSKCIFINIFDFERWYFYFINAFLILLFNILHYLILKVICSQLLINNYNMQYTSHISY